MSSPNSLFSAFILGLALTGSVFADSSAVVVFNEVQYNPPGATEDGEWLELFNQQGIKVDLSGWRIDGLGYTFPGGTIIEAGDYLVVAKTPTGGQLGPFSGSIDNGGERLRLYNQSERLMDEIDFGDDGLWPAGADGSGATLAKIHPYTTGEPPQSWAVSEQLGGTPGAVNFFDASAPPVTTTTGLVALADVWRYNEAGVDLGASWSASAHPVGGDWEDGPGGLAFESGATIPIGTPLSFPTFNDPYVVTYYFEHDFSLTAAQLAGLDSLNLRHGFDGGGIVYLNGVEVLRVNMPAGAVSAATLSLNDPEVDVLSGNVPIPSGALVAGSNRISVEVHQGSIGSSDVVFGLELDAEIAGAAAGAAPQIVLNEVPPVSEPAFWVELKNDGLVAEELAGITLSAGGDPLREYVLPAGQLAPGALLLINEATLGFRPADSEKLFVYEAGGSALLDARQVTGRLRGRSGTDWLYPSAATPGTGNSFALNDSVVISEIAYNPPSLAAVSAVVQPVALVAMADNWRYNDNDENLPTGWAASAHAVGGNWSQGAGPIGRENSTIPVPLVTDLAATYQASTITYYFETDFMVAAAQVGSFDSLQINHQLDDGAVFYLNGVEVGRFNMPVGAIGPETLASPSVGNAALNTTAIDSAALVAGMNRLSVEVHQSTAASSDMVFGAALEGVVEISPAQPFRNSDNQWLEIANRSAAAVDLGGWEFNDGIRFEFPAGTMLAAGEHACVVRETAEFSAAYPGARILGEFSGSLSRGGERVHLRDANRNPVDTVRYYDGGAWPGDADGGGKTLELRDLDADNSVGGAWADSDEFANTAWRTYTYTESAATRRGPDNQWREFNMGLMGSGEVLIDDVTVSTGLIVDSGFDNPSAWRLRGSHGHSEIIDDPDQAGNKVLRLVATGPTEHMHNQIETTLSGAVSSATTYTISFRARWVSGTNQLHTRLYFNRCANMNVIDRPAEPGTPSAPNSSAEANIAPTFSGLKHDPPVPAVNEVTTVSIAASDPQGVSSMTLHYAVDGGAWQTVAMGSSGGRYQAGVPGQSAGALVQFYVEGTDGSGASAFFPPEGPDSRALYKVDDGLAATNGWRNFRVLLTAADVAFQHTSTQVMSNDRLPCTIIDREGDIYYNCGVRLKSSQRGRNNLNRVGYNIRFPADGLFRGSHDGIAIDRSEGQAPGQRELLFDMMMANSGGVLSRYYDFVKVLAPNPALTGGATFQFGRYDQLFLDSQFEDGSDGRVYEYELIYYPTSANGAGEKLPQPDSVTGVSPSNLGDDPEFYRWFFLNKINREADDFAPIIAYGKKMSQSGAAFEDGLEDIVDVDDWLRGMAYAVLTGAGDNAAANSQHNGLYYAKPDGRIMFLPHDMDFSFSTTRSITSNSECNKLVGDPRRLRIYLGHLHDIITTTYNQPYMSMWSNHFNDLDPSQDWNTDLNHCVSRSNNVLSQISSRISSVAFDITTSSPLTVAAASADVSGQGWVNVRDIRVAGSPELLEVTWADGDSWQVSVPVQPGSQTVTLEALDFSGAVIGTQTITINNTSTTEPASAANVVISELHYHPSDPTAAEIAAGFTDADQFEWLEIMNIGANPVDLTGVRFGAGLDYDFATGAELAAGARLVVVRDPGAFLSRNPGAAAFMATGAFLNDTGLSNGGERLELLDAGGVAIRDFSYEDDLPWPELADGDGPSMTLIAPGSDPDHALATSWRPSVALGGSPGTGDAIIFVGDPEANVDCDGMSAFLEFAFGTSDASADGSPVTVTMDSSGGLILTHPRNLAADNVAWVIELSTDLQTWTAAGPLAQLSSETAGSAGTSLLAWSITANAAGERRFVRVRAEAP